MRAPSTQVSGRRLSTTLGGYTSGVAESQIAEKVIGGRYRLGRVLGEGGMARVYEAYDERLERHVAVKILHRDTEALPGMRERFAQEARLAARLTHPNIVAVLDYGEDGSSCFLVMERLPGTTLRDEISRGPIPMGLLVPIVIESLAALDAAHRFGVLHRDIKPSNILLQDDGHAKIADFGIAKSFDIGAAVDGMSDDMTQTGVVLGTPGYLAPERQLGQPATVQSDLYAVGAVMLEAVTGARVKVGIASADAIPAPWRDIAARALAPDPHDRFASADTMRRALAGLQRERASAPAPADATPVPTQPFPAPITPGPSRTEAVPAALAPRDIPRAPHRPRRRLLAGLVVALGLVGGFTIAYALAHQTGGHKAPRDISTGAQAKHGTKRAPSPPVDTVAAGLRAEASSLSAGTMPGDGALASALNATAAEPPGAARLAAAQRAMTLAQVLESGNVITTDQYQAATATLESAGATPSLLPPAPQEAPSQQTPDQTPPQPTPLAPPSNHGHGHGHGHNSGGDGSQS